MNNEAATACKKCHTIIFYDRDGKEPELCPTCRNEKEAEEKK